MGAEPLFFLDYFATSELEPAVFARVVGAMADACARNGAALLGGETAEMPGMYAPGTYDLAGFLIGSVARDGVLGPERVREGDVLVGLPSTGLHTNGYTLARKIVFEWMKLGIDDLFPETTQSVTDVLLTVHRSYAPVVRPILDVVHAFAHVTGGGIAGNLVRVLPAGVEAVIDAGSWPWPSLFRVLMRGGQIDRAEMRQVFNLGIGMIAVVSRDDVESAVRAAERAKVPAWIIGEIRPSKTSPSAPATVRFDER
jgi:phosphoribosylformylglycinamidine cyclo-ligase